MEQVSMTQLVSILVVVIGTLGGLLIGVGKYYLNTLNKQIALLMQEINSLHKDVSILNRTIDKLVARVERLEEKINEKKETDSRQYQQIRDLQKSHEALDKRLVVLEVKENTKA